MPRAGRVARAVGAVAAVLLAALPAMAVADGGVDAGDLRAAVTSDPWHLEFLDRGGGRVLSEVPSSSGAGPTGTLGFNATGGWRHATGIQSERAEGSAYVMELATTDPAGRRISVRLEPDATGVIRLTAEIVGGPATDVTATGIAFASRPGERFLGFGERSNAVDQRGREVENYVAEGPYQEEERPFIAGFVPPPGYHPRDDATYFPVPWLLSTAGYGVLIDNSETSYFRLGSEVPDAWSLEVQSARLVLRVFAGPKPADVLRRMTARIGRQPPPAAPWFFGPWYQPTGSPEQRIEREKLLLDSDAPLSVAQTYTHYLPCGDHVGNRDGQKQLVARHNRSGLAVTTYFNPMICEDYQPVFDEAVRREVLTKNQLGEPYRYRYTGTEQFLVGQVDFSAPGADDFWAGLLGEAIDDGYEGWMEDFGEYTPLDSRSANGMGGAEMHNLYPTLYHCASSRNAQRRSPRVAAPFIRSGWTGVQPCAQLVWNGDPTTDWGFDGLESAVKNALSIGLSGISRWGSDIGGFFSLGNRATELPPPAPRSKRLTPELLIRWIELGAVSGIMRTQANGFPLPPYERPQVWDRAILPIWRRYAKLRTQLYPYLVAADAEYRRTGMPAMRHLALAYPGDPAAEAREDEFLFGPDLLAAPVINPGETKRRLYAPAGSWIDFWGALRFRKSDGSLRLRRTGLLNGRRELELRAPLEHLPMLIRAGALLPLLPPDVDTLADHGEGSVVKLSRRRDGMSLLAFPRGSSSARFDASGARASASAGAGGLLKSRERTGSWELVVSDGVRRRYYLQAALWTLRRGLRPCGVTVNGRPLPARDWRYKRSTRVLVAKFRARRARVRVSACS